MQKVHMLKEVADEFGMSYWTIRRWCRANLIEFSRLPSGVMCLTDKQIEKLLERMAANGNAGSKIADAR